MARSKAREWTEGVCGDAAAILCDGRIVPIADLLNFLNEAEEALVRIAAVRYGLDQNEDDEERARYWSEMCLAYRRRAAQVLSLVADQPST